MKSTEQVLTEQYKTRMAEKAKSSDKAKKKAKMAEADSGRKMAKLAATAELGLEKARAALYDLIGEDYYVGSDKEDDLDKFKEWVGDLDTLADQLIDFMNR